MIRCMQNVIDKAAPEYKALAKKAITATTLAIGALCTPWETTRIIGTTILTGIGYGVTNELIASWGCSQHFSSGHISDPSHLRSRPIQGLNSFLNAIISGMVDYWSISALAGVIFAFIARAPLPIFRLQIRTAQITSSLAKCAALITLLVQTITRAIQKYYNINKQKTCNMQHAASYSSLTLVSIFLGTAILATRVGLIKL